MAMPGRGSWINTWKWEGKGELMCQTGAGGQPWKSQERDGSRAGQRWEQRWGSGPSPQLWGWSGTMSSSIFQLPQNLSLVSYHCSHSLAWKMLPRQGISGVQCRASGSNSQNMNYCKVVVGGNAARNLPIPGISIYRLFRLNSIFLPLALEQGKCILKGKFYREGKIKAIIMASSMCWEARKPPGLSQRSKGALQATTF